MMRQAWRDKGEDVAVVSRATVSAQQKPGPVDDSELLLRRLIDEEYTRAPVLWRPQEGGLPQGGGP